MRDQDGAQIPRRDRPSRASTGSSAATARSTAARSRPSPPPATRNTSRASARRRRASTMSPSAISTSCAPAIDRRDRGDPGRAGAGRRRRARRLAPSISRACARSATSTACSWSSTRCSAAWAAPASSSPMNGPDVDARHHGDGQGAGRRLPGRRLPRDREGGQGMTAGTPRLDLRRQSARHGGRQCRARRDAGAEASSSSVRRVSGYFRRQAQGAGRQISRHLRRGARQGPAGRPALRGPQQRGLRQAARRRAADGDRRRQRACACCRRSSSRRATSTRPSASSTASRGQWKH